MFIYFFILNKDAELKNNILQSSKEFRAIFTCVIFRQNEYKSNKRKR